MKFAIAAILLLTCFHCASCVSWRIFLGREDCVSESIPENQLAILRESFRKRNAKFPDKLNVLTEVGFLVANKYGEETSRGTVDVYAKNPDGEIIYKNEGVKEDTFSLVGRGSPSGWEVCFKISHAESSVQHSLTIELSYFTVNMRALVGTGHEKMKDSGSSDLGLGVDVDVDSLAKTEDIGKVASALRSLYIQLSSIRQMERFLKMRTERHMKTVKSTHRRTLFWSSIEALVIISASLVQVLVVQRFFNSTNKALRV
eukprot:g6988.t1